MPTKTRNILILVIVAIILIILIILGLSAYFAWKLSQPKPLAKPVGSVVSSTQQMAGLIPALMALLPPDFDKSPFQILQNEKREISDGSTQYVFSYLDESRTLPQIYAYYRHYLKTNAELSIDRLYKDNFVLEAQAKKIDYNIDYKITGVLNQKNSSVAISLIFKK